MDKTKKNKYIVIAIVVSIITILAISAIFMIKGISKKTDDKKNDENTTHVDIYTTNTSIVCKKKENSNELSNTYKTIEIYIDNKIVTSRKSTTKTIYSTKEEYEIYKQIDENNNDVKYDDTTLSAIYEETTENFNSSDSYGIMINYEEYVISLINQNYECK